MENILPKQNDIVVDRNHRRFQQLLQDFHKDYFFLSVLINLVFFSI